MKILLVNYDHEIVGGCETMYKHLHNTFPNSELISALKDFKGKDLKEVSEKLDKYFIERNKKEDILLIGNLPFSFEIHRTRNLKIILPCSMYIINEFTF